MGPSYIPKGKCKACNINASGKQPNSGKSIIGSMCFECFCDWYDGGILHTCRMRRNRLAEQPFGAAIQ